MVEWSVKGKVFGNCNCSYGCPCQFGDIPTHGYCQAALCWQIDEGHFGPLRLDGTLVAGIYKWPGPIHNGDGSMQLIIDERADAEQRGALEKIATGQETMERTTMWWIYGTMSPNKRPTLYKPFEFSVDIDARRGRVSVPGVLEMEGEPIRNVVSGAETRARIDLPNGFEFRFAEIGSASTKAMGQMRLFLKNSWGLFAKFHLGHTGRLD